jgi:hypothetical protein
MGKFKSYLENINEMEEHKFQVGNKVLSRNRPGHVISIDKDGKLEIKDTEGYTHKAMPNQVKHYKDI